MSFPEVIKRYKDYTSRMWMASYLVLNVWYT